MRSFFVLLRLLAGDCKSLNIYYFYQYSPSHMQNKSSNIQSHLHTKNVNPSLSNSQTPLEFKEVLPLKIAFTNWIKTLPMEERFVAAKIYAPGLSKAIRSIFWQKQPVSLDRNLQYQTFRLDSPQQTNYCQSKKSLSKLQKHLLQSLVFLSDGHDFLDNLCFDFSLLECPQRLFDMLTCNVKHQHAKLMDEALNSKKNVGSLLKIIQQVKIKELILEELFNFMRQSMLVNFRNSLIESIRISHLLQQQKQRKKDFSIYWRNISLQRRQNILLLQCKDISELISYLKKQRIQVSQQEINKQIGQLLLLEKNEFCNKIFKCKLKKAMNPLFDYYELIYLIWKKDVDKNKRKKYNKNRRDRDYNSQQKCEQKQVKSHKKKDKNRKSTSVQSNQTNQTEHQRIFAENSRSNGSVQKRQISSTFIQCQKYIERQQFLIITEKSTNQVTLDQKSTYESEQKQEIIKNQTSIMIKKQNQEYLDCHTPQKQKNKSNQTNLNQKNHNFKQRIAEEIVVKASLQKLEFQIEEMSDQISQQANYYHQRRVIAFERIQFLLSYYAIPIKLFGSCANGIAVKNSDIDIAIDQAILSQMEFIPESQKVRVALQNLEQIFKNYPTFKQIKVIKTAAIPVMKLMIDTSIPFLCPEYGEIYESLNRSHNYGSIHADVTIQTPNKQNQSSHLGIRTTSAISEWLSSIKSLRSIVIVMKSILTISRLNLAYQGGLNTFAMIVMLVAYIRHKKLENQQNSAFILREILYFYCQEFDQKSYGIDLLCSKQNQIYYNKQRINGSPSKTMKADLQIIDPICQSKNMTRNCYLYAEIKKLFKNMLNSCFIRAEKQLSQSIKGQNALEKVIELNKSKFSQRNVFKQWQKSITAHF